MTLLWRLRVAPRFLLVLRDLRPPHLLQRRRCNRRSSVGSLRRCRFAIAYVRACQQCHYRLSCSSIFHHPHVLSFPELFLIVNRHISAKLRCTPNSKLETLHLKLYRPKREPAIGKEILNRKPWTVAAGPVMQQRSQMNVRHTIEVGWSMIVVIMKLSTIDLDSFWLQ